MNHQEIAEAVKALMPEAILDLKNLVRHASCAFPGYPPEPVRATFGKRAVARGKRRQHSSSLHPGRHLSDGRVLVLWGAEDVAQARIHGPDESVDVAEIERSIIAQTLFITRLGEIRDSL